MNRNVCGSATEASKVLLENNIANTDCHNRKSFYYDCQFADLESMDDYNHYFHDLND